ncbi:hypothetical protein D3C71_1748640 [compost metagenome]
MGISPSSTVLFVPPVVTSIDEVVGVPPSKLIPLKFVLSVIFLMPDFNSNNSF